MRLASLFLLSLLLLSSGCVERSVTIESEPTGAMVYLDGEFLGNTPVKYNFTYYGDHSIRISKDGHRSVVGVLSLHTPMWQKPGIDFFSENVIPWTITDDRTAMFTLEPAEKADAAASLARARELAEKAKEYEEHRKGTEK